MTKRDVALKHVAGDEQGGGVNKFNHDQPRSLWDQAMSSPEVDRFVTVHSAVPLSVGPTPFDKILLFA